MILKYLLLTSCITESIRLNVDGLDLSYFFFQGLDYLFQAHVKTTTHLLKCLQK